MDEEIRWLVVASVIVAFSMVATKLTTRWLTMSMAFVGMEHEGVLERFLWRRVPESR